MNKKTEIKEDNIGIFWSVLLILLVLLLIIGGIAYYKMSAGLSKEIALFFTTYSA
ncbi:MAG: hypothetical protein SNJ70_00700 [Armatimonadota bacterium]